MTDWPLAIENNAAVSCDSGGPDMLTSFFSNVGFAGATKFPNVHVFHCLYYSAYYTK